MAIGEHSAQQVSASFGSDTRIVCDLSLVKLNLKCFTGDSCLSEARLFHFIGLYGIFVNLPGK